MPELAEVEHERKATHTHCVGKRIVNVRVISDELVYNGITATEFAQHLQNKEVRGTGRHGKFFFVILNQSPHILLHLGMTGTIRIKGVNPLNYQKKKDEEVWPPPFWKFLCIFEDETEWSFTNTRRLGRIKLVNDPLNEPPISLQGPDVYLSMPMLDNFSSHILMRSAPIKALLLDQKFLAGLGNWMVDEILYQSAIHPAQPCNTLTDAQLAKLHSNVKMVSNIAIEANADAALFPKDWLFHYRWSMGKKSAFTLNGQKIEFKTVGGRTSAFVPHVQKLQNKMIMDRRRKETSRTSRKEVTLENSARQIVAKDMAMTTESSKVKKREVEAATTDIPNGKRSRSSYSIPSDSTDMGNLRRSSRRRN